MMNGLLLLGEYITSDTTYTLFHYLCTLFIETLMKVSDCSSYGL